MNMLSINLWIVHQFLLTFQKKVLKETEEAIEEMYAIVNKRRKSQVSEEEEAPLIPPHIVDELYAAVNKTLNDSVAEEAPPTRTITHTRITVHSSKESNSSRSSRRQGLQAMKET